VLGSKAEDPVGAGVVGAATVALSPPGTSAVNVMATTVPTSLGSGEEGGTGVPLVSVGGACGRGTAQAMITIVRVRKAVRG